MKQETTLLLERYKSALRRFVNNNNNTIPFCAAEPIASPFTRSALNSDFSERYIKSGASNFDAPNEFIGSEFIYPLYEIINNACKSLFKAKYADPRPLSGMNAALTATMCLTEPNDRVLLLSPDAGGHESYPEICRRLSLHVDEMPFDYENVDYRIAETNALLQENRYSAVILPPSDLIIPPPIDEFDLPENTSVLYDCTQSFGLIAAGIHPNPMKANRKVVLLGGTHKTVSGPTSGLILCNNDDIIPRIENTITPIYVRNPHPHHVASLALALIEFIEHGNEYMEATVRNSNTLGDMLDSKQFNLKRLRPGLNEKFTLTHQLFLSVTEEDAYSITKTARNLNISMDKKDKKMYGQAGIRIGSQAVTRLGWGTEEFSIFANLMQKIRNGDDEDSLLAIAEKIRGKNHVHFSISANEHGFLGA